MRRAPRPSGRASVRPAHTRAASGCLEIRRRTGGTVSGTRSAETPAAVRLARVPGFGPVRRDRPMVAGQDLVWLPLGMVRSVADRAFLPVKSLRAHGQHGRSHGQDALRRGEPSWSLWRRVPVAVHLRSSSAGFRWLSLWWRRRSERRASSGELPVALRRSRPAWRVLHPRLGQFAPFVSAILVAGVAGTALTRTLALEISAKSSTRFRR